MPSPAVKISTVTLAILIQGRKKKILNYQVKKSWYNNKIQTDWCFGSDLWEAEPTRGNSLVAISTYAVGWLALPRAEWFSEFTASLLRVVCLTV